MQTETSAETTSSQSSAEAAAIIKPDTKLLNAPPMPADEQSVSVPYNQQNDNSSIFLGMIFWSVIGIVVTAVLIIILNLKGADSEFAFSRKRYHKGENNSVSHINIR